MKRTSWWQGLSVTGGGTGVVAHAGLVAVRLLADRVGLTDRLSQVLARRGFRPAHDRGQVLVDVATMLVGGGEAISDIDTLRHQERLLGPVASPATVWRTLSGLTPAAWKKINTARGKTRGFVWGQLGRLPASRVAGTTLHPDVVVLDADATLVVCHSEKEQASPTYKKTFGYHPLGIWCDNTTELLAIKLRPGSAGSNTAADHIEVLTEAIAQIPAGHRRHLLVRADGAGATHQLLDWLHGLDAKRGRRVEYSVGFPITAAIQDAIGLIPEKVWAAALDADGGVRDGADVAEVTGLIDLTGWPEGMRVIVRREHPHPGAQLSLFEAADGYRYQSFATNTQTGQLGFLEARHRAHARVEDRIRHAKDTGLGRFPSREFAINTAWAQLVAIAADLTAWLRLLALEDDLAIAEPKKLRYRLLHIPGRLVRGGRRRRLRLPDHWPWTTQLLAALTKINTLPAPT
jgi:Transposase DDE domain group 1